MTSVVGVVISQSQLKVSDSSLSRRSPFSTRSGSPWVWPTGSGSPRARPTGSGSPSARPTGRFLLRSSWAVPLSFLLQTRPESSSPMRPSGTPRTLRQTTAAACSAKRLDFSLEENQEETMRVLLYFFFSSVTVD
ncbi:hypothetical protein EYF80_032295 [Liparis tanakae]|uniref:Uncharacterized protein n=1 Tax=Liparis tanakae TaxID=230148 RepID=A0A4Z2GW02_9TELE|nr:hypothetical protein EYF80_032295 [Liparis tanakae]